MIRDGWVGDGRRYGGTGGANVGWGSEGIGPRVTNREINLIGLKSGGWVGGVCTTGFEDL